MVKGTASMHSNTLATTLPVASAGVVGLPPVQRTTTAPATGKHAGCRLPSAKPMPPFIPAADGADDDAAQLAGSLRPLCTSASGAVSTVQPPLLSAFAARAEDVPAQPTRCPTAELSVLAPHSVMPIVATQAAAAKPTLPDVLPHSVARQLGDVPENQYPSSADALLPEPEPAQPHTHAGQEPGQAAEVTAVGATPGGAAPPQPQQLEATEPKSACSPLLSRQQAPYIVTASAGATARKPGSAGRARDPPATLSARSLPHRGARDRKIDRDELGLGSIEHNRMMQRRKEEQEAAAQPVASPHGGALPKASRGAAARNGAVDGQLLVDGEVEDRLTCAGGSKPNSAGVPQQTKGERKKLRAKRLSAKQVMHS